MADKESSPDVSSASPAATNPLSKKLNKVLDTRLENDKDLLEALKALSGFFTENCLRSRRNLRGDIERRSLTISEEFVDAFRAVKQELDNVYADVRDMNECCQDMTSRLKLAKEQTHDLLNQTTTLKAESAKVQMKSKVTDMFLDKFQLKPEEVRVLRGTRATLLQEDFFKVLNRVKQIHTDCKILLRTNHQTAGLEIMESMALHQETAYERLYRWAQNECRMLTGDYPDVSQLLCQAMVALSDRPVLFKYSLDEFGTARRTAMVRGFIDALTRGGPGGTPRPIELHSHDPLRYVGDMLAWVHQATASEKEHLETLLKHCDDRETEIGETLAHITEGICRPFKVRIEQVLVSEQDAVVLYKLSNLLKFYHNTVGQMLAHFSPLLTTTIDMETLAHKMFINTLSSHANKLMDKVELPPPDLSATNSLTDSLRLLRDVLASHDTFVLPIADKKNNFKQILSCMVDPLLQMCSVSASRLNSTDMAAYMVNCIYQIQTTLALYEYTDEHIEKLQAQIDAHVDTLVNEQASFILTRVDLVKFYGFSQQHTTAMGPMSTFEGFDGAAMKLAMSKFDSFLASPDTLLLSQSALLLSNTIRETVRRGAMDLLLTAYTQMYDIINSEEGGYRDAASIVPRTPDHVSKLLS